MIDIGKEYGTALFMLACENKAEREYSAALKTVKSVLTADSDYMNFLSSPAIPRTERLDSIEAAFAGRLPDEVLSFIMLMCEKGRITCLDEAVGEYEKLLAVSERRSYAKITSAVELSDDEKASLIKKLETSNGAASGAKIEAEYEVDSTIIGGLIVEIDGKVIDGSIRSRLREFKEVMRT